MSVSNDDEYDEIFSSQGYTPMSNTKDPRHDEKELRKQRQEALDHPENQELWSHPQAPSTPGAPDKIIRHEKALELEKQQTNVNQADVQTKKQLEDLSNRKTQDSKKKPRKKGK